jgi:deoxyribodipyrimidine photo-lyase
MSVALVWLRRDLRCHDNPALINACRQHRHILVVYLHDSAQQRLGGAQHWWLHHSLLSLNDELHKVGLSLTLRQGNNALVQLRQLVDDHAVTAVYWNRCYEPQTMARDSQIKQALRAQGLMVESFNSHLLLEPWQVKNQSGQFFKVFTPFWNYCLQHAIEPKRLRFSGDFVGVHSRSDALTDWQLLPKNPNWAKQFEHHWSPGEVHAKRRLQAFMTSDWPDYKDARNYPAQQATSRLSPHLHFGEISPWDIWRAVHHAHCPQRDQFLAELGWREFSYHLLYHVPELDQRNFKSAFDVFPWIKNTKALHAWQRGLTGFPIVDAGMRELRQTGFMHNRVRMIVASFLTKDLLIDWRLGADWFLDNLLDADLASNSAGWQWVAGCGADAAPYFRIFNPVLQGEKFDANGDYVRLWVPELAKLPAKWIHKPWLAPKGILPMTLGKDYPWPIVDHRVARARALAAYQALKD